MKKSMIKIVAFLFLGVAMFSCEKEGVNLNERETTSAQTSVKTFWSVPIDDLDKELNALFSESEENWNKLGIDKKDVLTIKMTSNKVLFYLVTPKVSLSKKIVCEGGGYSFASCSKDWLAKHPGRCLTIWQVGETYYASDDCVIP